MNTSSLSVARAYALSMHGAQMYGAHPYSHHLDAVALTLLPYGQEAQVIGYLHDVVEDTDATLAEVRLRFGDQVAACVALLTDEPGANRKERKSKTYAKLAGVTGAEELALVVKVADRLSNVRACVADAHRDLWNVYRGEHVVFKAAAFRAGLCDALWSELDELMSDEKQPRNASKAES
ncbi:HD domain-containing protein [Variovorax boronicumulans]|uniref:HD domain-containing protein n=1 Tax=Variovorax boronicumulans TaxID=436515 RepID=UPI00132FB308|nr:HD domain-containing protein [Variovorax boronicumulans]